MVLQAIKYRRGQLDILNQLKLPYVEEWDSISSTADAWQAIKDMRTRGAPAIAIVAALSLCIELENLKIVGQAADVSTVVVGRLDYLVTSRPTAVNLADAAGKLAKVVKDAAAKDGASGDDVKRAYVEAVEQMLVDDVRDNKKIGKHGAEWIVKSTNAGHDGKASILTHCNTG